jgi:hypothetical protein
MTRHAPDSASPLVARGGGAAAFGRTGTPPDDAVTLVETGGRMVESQARVHPVAEVHLSGASLAAAPFGPDRVSGWVFFTDIPRLRRRSFHWWR